MRTFASLFVLLVAGGLLAMSILTTERWGSGPLGEHVEYHATGESLLFGALGLSLGAGWAFARRHKP